MCMEYEEFLTKLVFPVRVMWSAGQAIRRQCDADLLARTQLRRLRRLVGYVYSHCKYYRERFDSSGVMPDHIRRLEDLAKLPFLTKDDIRTRFWELLGPTIPACRVTRTSGSTGVPVCVLSDMRSRVQNSAAVIRYRHALGIGFWGRPIVTPLKTPSDEWNRVPHWTFAQGIHKTYYVNPYNMSSENLTYMSKVLGALNGAVLIGIAPAVAKLACLVRDGVVSSFRPFLAMTTGATLQVEERQRIEQALGTRVADIYGCNEGGDIAWQCLRGEGYHVNADNVIVEIVRDGQPVPDGQIGEVVITNLNRFAMPIIRYKNGDLARVRKGECGCGCKLPLIAEIVGRTGEDIRMSDGSDVPWHELKSLVYHPGVRQFQIVQEPDLSLVVRYVREPDCAVDAIETVIATRLGSRLGNRVRISFQSVAEIIPEKSGKYRMVISPGRSREGGATTGLAGPHAVQ